MPHDPVEEVHNAQDKNVPRICPRFTAHTGGLKIVEKVTQAVVHTWLKVGWKSAIVGA